MIPEGAIACTVWCGAQVNLLNADGGVVSSHPCARQQFLTPTGMICSEGHGGADSIDTMGTQVDHPMGDDLDRLRQRVLQQGLIENALVEMPASAAEDRLVVVLGEQVFAPVQYHSFRIGPFTLERRVLAGPVPGRARAMLLELRAVAEEAFREALPEHLRRVELAAKGLRDFRGIR